MTTRCAIPLVTLGALIALLAACTLDEPAAPTIGEGAPKALIGGAIDTDDPAVVALTRGGSASFCTGTLISPRVVLTAAHCIDMLGNDPSANIYFGSDTTGNGARITVGQKKQHPMWTGDLSGGHDVGMLLMDFPYEDPTIARELNRVSPSSDHVGDDYRHVGFGVFDRATGSADGKKRQGTTTITSTERDVIISGDENLSVCFGDSGGPAFLTIEGKELVSGIHSYTSSSECFPPNGDTDVQKYADDFILPWVQENDPSCGQDGVCGPIGCVDDPDCLPCGPNGTCVENCELPDLDCQTQEVGDICKAASQCTTGSCVAYRDDPDYRFCSETCTPSNDTCPSGMSCQLINPFGNVCYYDESPPGALGDSCTNASECGSYRCEEGLCVITCDYSIGQGCPETFLCESHDGNQNYYCFEKPGEEGGCQVATGTTGALWLVLLGLLGLVGLRRRPSVIVGILLTLVMLAPTIANANGRFPATTNVRFSPSDNQLVLLPATFGLLVSTDGAETFHWVCEDTVGYAGTYDPDYAITAANDIYATTFAGLQVSHDGGCTFEQTEFYNDLTGGNTPVLLTNAWVGEVEVASDGKIWATTSTGGAPNDIYVSTDGQRFDSAGNLHPIAWWKTLRVSTSTPDTVYISGFLIASGEEPAQALLYKTTNGGTTWTDIGVTDFAFGTHQGAQPNLFLEGISETNPSIVYARVLGARSPQGDDIYRTGDGGASWTKVLEMHGVVTAFAVLADETVIVGSATPCTEDFEGLDPDAGVPNKGCVFTSSDGTVGTWTRPTDQPKLGCVGERASDNSLYGCGSNFAPDLFAFGNSTDSGESWTSTLLFDDIVGPLECAAGTKQEVCAREVWPGQCVALGKCEPGDAGVVNVDAGIGPDASGGGGGGGDTCLGCQSGSRGGIPFFLTALALFRRRKSEHDS